MTREELLNDLTMENFIAWVESIPEDEWTIDVQEDKQGKRCFHGHLNYMDRREMGNPVTAIDEEAPFNKFFCENFGWKKEGVTMGISPINNGDERFCRNLGYPLYHLPTPKQRVLAFLKDQYVKKKKLSIKNLTGKEASIV